MIADTHCHLDFEGLRSGLDLALDQMLENGVGALVVPSVKSSKWEEVEGICKKDSRLSFALGMHPVYIEEHSAADLLKLEQKILELKSEKNSAFVAVGEIGLDFVVSCRDKQIGLFESQLVLAEKYKLPVILHCRKAHSEMLAILKSFKLVGGVIHAFSGSYELMMRFIDAGLKIGVGPVITWPTANKTRVAISRAPLASLVLETDSPDMAVDGRKRGEGHPFDVVKVFEGLKKIRKESSSDLEEALWLNSVRLFNKASF